MDRLKNQRKNFLGWSTIIALGLMVLFLAPLAKIAAGIAIAYGAWTIYKKED